MGRPVAVQMWNGTTSTGTSSAGSATLPLAYFGTGMTRATLLFSNASTKALDGKLQGSMGNSTSWFDVIGWTTAQSTGASVMRTSTGSFVFDKLRLNITANATTGSAKVWALAAGGPGD